ncbi:MAG: hypothetical protein ACJA1Z_000635 [Patiriisocius sp.]|jgi:hypothetical protein
MIFSGDVSGFVYLGVYDIDTSTYKEILQIPSSGDGSCPGMII